MCIVRLLVFFAVFFLLQLSDLRLRYSDLNSQMCGTVVPIS